MCYNACTNTLARGAVSKVVVSQVVLVNILTVDFQCSDMSQRFFEVVRPGTSQDVLSRCSRFQVSHVSDIMGDLLSGR